MTGFSMMETFGLNEIIQQRFTCSKSTIEKLEKGAKYV